MNAFESYSIDADPNGIRARVVDAVTGALAFGAQGTNPAPADHWLAPFWNAAKAEAVARAAATRAEFALRALVAAGFVSQAKVDEAMTLPGAPGEEEPAAYMTYTEEGDPSMLFFDRAEARQYCEDDEQPTPLYAAPQPADAADGWVRVPRDPTPAMSKAAADAWLDCGSRLFLNKAAAAVRAGIAAAPPSQDASKGVGHG